MPSPNAKATDVTNVQWAMMTQTGSRDFPYLESVEFAPQLEDRAALPEKIVLGHTDTKRIYAYLQTATGESDIDPCSSYMYLEEWNTTEWHRKHGLVRKVGIPHKDLDVKNLRYPFRCLASEGMGFSKAWDAKQLSDFVRACFISKGLTKDGPINYDKPNMSALRAAIKKIVISGHHTPKTPQTSRDSQNHRLKLEKAYKYEVRGYKKAAAATVHWKKERHLSDSAVKGLENRWMHLQGHYRYGKVSIKGRS